MKEYKLLLHCKEILRNFDISNVPILEDDKEIKEVNKTFYHPNLQLSNCSFKEDNQLIGRVPVFLEAPSFQFLNNLYPDIKYGGHFYPNNCIANQKVAIIVPYKNRQAQLRVFLHNIHNTLQKHYIDYVIILVEPTTNGTFNRGKLLNIGFKEALKLYHFDCIILHDVDLIPEDDRNIYQCSKYPRHMSSHINKFSYELPYEYIFGGVSALSTEQFQLINGYNNMYWGWGMEDDDLYERIKYKNLKVSRYPSEISRYYMLIHEHENENSINDCRYSIYHYYKYKVDTEGLNSLNYVLEKVEFYQLYTKILVDPLEEISKKQLHDLGLCIN
uniref:Beta-1,4-N-acetylgalactosaminyltransferase n=1 Tax=Strongyloides venezuelensis TaxID=75913 RepID=A0A0K0F8J5_STRVS